MIHFVFVHWCKCTGEPQNSSGKVNKYEQAIGFETEEQLNMFLLGWPNKKHIKSLEIMYSSIALFVPFSANKSTASSNTVVQFLNYQLMKIRLKIAYILWATRERVLPSYRHRIWGWGGAVWAASWRSGGWRWTGSRWPRTSGRWTGKGPRLRACSCLPPSGRHRPKRGEMHLESEGNSYFVEIAKVLNLEKMHKRDNI